MFGTMRKLVIGVAALLLAVSCGGDRTVCPVDLSPWKGADSLYRFTVKDVTFSLAPMPGGTFAMGETPDMGRYRTPAIHQVILDGYAIGTAEVSQALWKAVMGSNPSPTDNPAAPVTRVTYNDVQKFLQKLSKAVGVPFRLPTEAEWEYAARQREDMVGNAWEWCSDRWVDDLGSMLTVNPAGTTEGDAHALRGGSALEKNNKPITRKAMAATSRAGDVGLRLAVSTGEAYPADIYDVLVSNKVARESFDGTDFKNETFTVGGVKFDMVAVDGGTFTITNLGMYGIDSFTPIINQPEVAILGLTTMEDKAVVRNGEIVIRPMMTLSLTADHRIIDGATAAEFLQRVKNLLENPALMLA